MKRVCLVVASLRKGGSERVVSVLANNWSTLPNIEVHLILLTRQNKYYAIDNKVNIHEVGAGNGKLIKALLTALNLRKTVKMINPQAVLSFNEIYNNLTLISLKGLTTNIFVSDRNNPDQKLPWIHNVLRRQLYRKCTGIIAQTYSAKTILQSLTKNGNIIVIPNPLISVKINSEIKREKIILNVGRNVDQKNQVALIEIFRQLEDESWKLVIVGEGPLRPELIKLVESYGLKDRVLFKNFTSEISNMYQSASVFAMTSLYEGLPNALMEALAHGLPAIAFNCNYGPSDLIKNRFNGFIINEGDNGEYLKKLSLLINNPKLRNDLGSHASEFRSKYEGKKISNQFLNFVLCE